jgi:hypothetical protein
MALEKNNGFAAPPRTEKELRALHRRAVRRAAAMSPQELMATIVRAGIVTKSGKLAKKYGG